MPLSESHQMRAARDLFSVAVRCATTPGDFNEDVARLRQTTTTPMHVRTALAMADEFCASHPDEPKFHAAFLLLLGATALDAPDTP
jgi:hypothetical protein